MEYLRREWFLNDLGANSILNACYTIIFNFKQKKFLFQLENFTIFANILGASYRVFVQMFI